MFKKAKPVPGHPVEYPAGTCVETPSGWFLINKDGKKYRIVSKTVLNSWNFPRIVKTSDQAISKYPSALTPLGFRDGTLLNDISSSTLYLVSGNKARHIKGLKTLNALGLTPKDAVWVSYDEILIMTKGDELP